SLESPLPPYKEIGEPEDAETSEAARWLKEVYQGDRMPQLTTRAIISGMCIGAVMSVSNLYVGLKTGWGLGVTITACIIAYAVFNALEGVIPAYRPETVHHRQNEQH